MLALQVLLAPALVGLSSLVSRRWGPIVGGWSAGLPLTSGPVVFIVALERGAEFASQSADAVLQAIVSLAAFAVAYAWSARRLPALPTTAIACTAYLVCTSLLYPFAPSTGMGFLVAAASLLVAYRVMPSAPGTAERRPLPRWDIHVRMLASALLVSTITSGAAVLGPRLSGLLTPFPVVASILAIATHRAEGAAAAAHLLTGLLLGLAAFAAFFFVVASVIVPWGLNVAFIVAAGVALLTQAIVLTLLPAIRRR